MFRLTRHSIQSGTLPDFPWARPFGDTFIFLAIAVVFTFGCGAWLVMFLEAGLKGLLGLFSAGLVQSVFVDHADVVKAMSALIAHATDCGAAVLLLGSVLSREQFNRDTLSINVKRLRYGVVQAILYAVSALIAERQLVAFAYSFAAPVAESAQVATARHLTGAAMTIMMVQTMLIAPILEELVYRGLIYNILRQSLKLSLPRYVWVAEVISVFGCAAMFTMVHVTASAPGAIFIGGIVLTLLYRVSGSLVCSMLLHAMLNAAVWYSILS